MATNKSVLEFVIKAKQATPNLTTILKVYSDNLKKAKQETITLNQALNTLNVTPMATLKQKSDELKTAMDRVKKAYKDGEITAGDYARAQANLKMKMEGLKGTTGGLTSAFAKIRSNLLGMAAAGYALGKSFGAYSTFEQKMAEVNTLLNVSSSEFKNLRGEILNMTSEIPQSASQLAAAEYDIVSAGVKLQDSARVLKLSAQAAIAGVTDTKTAVNVGVGVINAYGMSVDQLNDVYDTLFMTVKNGVTTFPELSQSIGTVLPVAKGAGVDFTTLSAAIAQLTKAGIKTPEAITGLKGAITALSSPTAEAKKAMDELGITWKGLIPTIKELTKYADRPDIMRKLIPDVQARMAVLSLAGNFDGLNQTLADFANKSGAMKAAYDKMKNTPENQIKKFKNAINGLMIEIGGFVSKVVLPIVNGIMAIKHSFDSADTITKIYIGTLTASVSILAAWNMGLGALAGGIKSLLVAMHTTLPVMEAFTGAMTLAKAAAMGGIVISIAVAGYNLTKLIGEISSLNNVLRESKRLSEQYTQQAQQYKYAANIQILSKEQLLKLSEKEREEYKKNLVAAMKYYTNLANANRMAATEAKRLLGIPLPFQSAKAKEAQKNAEKLDAETNKIRKALIQLSHESKPAVANLNKSIESTHPVFMLSIADAKLLGAQLKKAYRDAQRDLKVWKDKVVAYENQIRQEKMSTNELIRNLQRKTMSEEDAWYDEQREAEETLAKAKEAYKKGDYELAKKLTKKAKKLYADLAKEVKTTNDEGQQEISMSLDETTQVAVDGIKKASNFMTDILKTQKNKAQDMENDYKQKVVNIKKLLNMLTQNAKKEIKLDVPNYNKIKSALDKLSMDVTKYIHIKYVKDGDATPEKHATGGQIAGYGGGDIVPALLEPGEFIVRKEAVKAYGASFIDLINKMRLPKNIIPKFQTGGLVETFNYWGDKFPVNLLLDKESAFAQLWEEMKKQGITHYIAKYSSTATPIRTWKHTWFDPWWEKQQIQHKDEIKKVKETEKVSIDLNFGNKSYPLQGDKSIVDELLQEIQRMKAVGV